LYEVKFVSSLSTVIIAALTVLHGNAIYDYCIVIFTSLHHLGICVAEDAVAYDDDIINDIWRCF